jgi:hypothetical protein
MIALQMQNGNFAVMTDEKAVGPVAVIVKTELGWKVMSRTAARTNSRTVSATPEQAAAKYFSRKVTFVRENILNLVAQAMGRQNREID